MFRQLRIALSLLLGIQMFTFGFLKFFQPFHGWFAIQIEKSHLPQMSIVAGQFGEMVTGCLFLLPLIWKISPPIRRVQLLLLACSMLVVQMSVAIYVHLQPAVPAGVLPLKIKTPVIPITVLLLALVTAFACWKERQSERSAGTQVPSQKTEEQK